MFNEIYEKIKKYDTIVIVRHIGADPDALCSQIALRDSIKLTFPKKRVFSWGSTSTRFNYLPLILFSSGSISIPKGARRSIISLLVDILFSPIPAVNAITSTCPSNT